MELSLSHEIVTMGCGLVHMYNCLGFTSNTEKVYTIYVYLDVIINYFK